MSSHYLRNRSRRLRSELRQLKDLPKEVISCSPVDEDENLEHWKAKIQGPEGTPYEKGVFILDVHISMISNNEGRLYPLSPPKIKFRTKVFHPNISSKGEICMDILLDHWSPTLTFSVLLLMIASLLSDPNVDDFLVPEAAFLYKENREEYDRKAREWTVKYAMAHGNPVEAQQTSKELNNLTDTVTTMYLTPSLSDHILQEEVFVIQCNTVRRPARFNVVEPLQTKTFDNGESKEYVPIVAACLWSRDDRQDTHRQQGQELDINNELQSLAIALEREGMKLEKQIEAELLINELYTFIDATFDKVGQGCTRLYSMQTFLYPQLNQFLREADSTKIETYGAFVRLLCLYFNYPSSIEVHSIEVYRGMNLSSTMIDVYKEATKSDTSFRWAGFSSTSKNREFAESFNTNTLFIMQLKKIYLREKKSIDISGYSQFPEEEEVLLKTGVEFTVEKVKYDDGKKKHYIYLNIYV